jgi:hypothetical protein
MRRTRWFEDERGMVIPVCIGLVMALLFASCGRDGRCSTTPAGASVAKEPTR